jgi:rhodanese-related sulfurtransferase
MVYWLVKRRVFMKKKSLLLVLALVVTLVFGTFQSVFATTGKPTDVTREAIEKAGVQCVQKIHNEVEAEAIAKTFAEEVVAGKYKLIDTATLAKELNSGIVIIDTMPESWWELRHIPGAICQIVGANDGANRFPIQPEEAKALVEKAKAACGATETKYYWNSKSKKWVTKKPAKKYWKKCSKKSDKNYGKKTKVVRKNFDKKIVVYCGFVGCARSHEGAKCLVENGFTNVYRYGAGISGWVDADLDIEGKDVEPAPEPNAEQ